MCWTLRFQARCVISLPALAAGPPGAACSTSQQGPPLHERHPNARCGAAATAAGAARHNRWVRAAGLRCVSFWRLDQRRAPSAHLERWVQRGLGGVRHVPDAELAVRRARRQQVGAECVELQSLDLRSGRGWCDSRQLPLRMALPAAGGGACAWAAGGGVSSAAQCLHSAACCWRGVGALRPNRGEQGRAGRGGRGRCCSLCPCASAAWPAAPAPPPSSSGWPGPTHTRCRRPGRRPGCRAAWGGRRRAGDAGGGDAGG